MKSKHAALTIALLTFLAGSEKVSAQSCPSHSHPATSNRVSSNLRCLCDAGFMRTKGGCIRPVSANKDESDYCIPLGMTCNPLGTPCCDYNDCEGFPYARCTEW